LRIRRPAKVLLLLLGLLALPAALSAQTAAVEELRKHAAVLEQRHDWLEACRIYDEILRKDRTREDVRQAYQRCLRRYHIVHRHRDRVYRQALTRITPVQALDMYEQVLDTVARAYVDRKKTDVTALFRQGIEELRLALDEHVFREEYFPGVPRETVDAFVLKLEEWRGRKIAGRSDARAQVMAIGRTAQQMGFGPRPLLLTVITLEFFSGACNALDEYTYFLTPGHFREVRATLRGQLVSIGVDLALVEDHLEIARVYPRSPAWEAGLARHDRILRIDGQPADVLLPEFAAERLRGKSGSLVKLQVLPAGQMMPRDLELTRRPVLVPSVDHELLRQPLFLDAGGGMTIAVPVGKLTIASFQETTLQEVKEALASLQTDGMKVLILDLRGNPGGLFKVAVQVAELFLPDGIIVISQSQVLSREKRLSGVIKVESMNPLLMPMVVLIDGDTASAAEMLAGALKENGRAKLIGQTTFGKGSIQCIIPLEKPPFDKMPGGIRITVARLLSPSWQPYSGQGVQPDIRSPVAEGDAVLLEAQQVLLEMLKTLQAVPVPH
jgi:carboxyl-terminal processing protease